MVVTVNDLPETDLASNGFGEHECVERERQLMNLSKFVSKFETIRDELIRPGSSFGGQLFYSLQVRLDVVCVQADIRSQAPRRVRKCFRDRRIDRAGGLGNRRKGVFEPVLVIGLVVRPSPLRIYISGDCFGAGVEPALERAI